MTTTTRIPSPAAAPQRLRRLDRRLATAVAAGMGAAFTFAAGRQARPVADAVPVELVWTVVVLLAVVAGVAGVLAVCQWYAEWAPYRHNRVLGPAAALDAAFCGPEHSDDAVLEDGVRTAAAPLAADSAVTR